MTIDLLFYSVSAAFLLMVLLMLLLKGYHSWIFGGFALFYSLLLLLIVLYSLLSNYSNSIELKITNYSSRKGNLFFFLEEGCQAPVRYDFPLNANEESRLEVESPEGSFSKIIFVGENDSLYTIPVPQEGSEELDIWEKEIKLADQCYRSSIERYQWSQIRFSLSIGIALLGLLLLFWYRWKKNNSSNMEFK